MASGLKAHISSWYAAGTLEGSRGPSSKCGYNMGLFHWAGFRELSVMNLP